MMTCMEDVMRKTADETLVLSLLRREGSATIEDLMALSRMSWEQVFGLVDRLSRPARSASPGWEGIITSRTLEGCKAGRNMIRYSSGIRTLNGGEQ